MGWLCEGDIEMTSKEAGGADYTAFPFFLPGAADCRTCLLACANAFVKARPL